MVRSFKKIEDLPIRTQDGGVGKLRDVFFDDRNWRIRHFVTELGSMFGSNIVLFAPSSAEPFEGSVLNLALTNSELKTLPEGPGEYSPSPLHDHDYTLSNMGSRTSSRLAEAPLVIPAKSISLEDYRGNDPHIRSCRDLRNYSLIASDGEIGHVLDVLIDDATWLLRFLVVDVTSVCSSSSIVLGPLAVDAIDSTSKSVHISLTHSKALLEPYFKEQQHLDIPYEKLVVELFGTPAPQR